MKHIKILLLLLIPIVASSQTNTVWLSGSTVDNTVVARNNFFVNGTGNLGGLMDTTGSVVGLPLGAVRVRPQDSIPYQYNGKIVGRKWVPVGSLGVSGVISVNGNGGAVTITTSNISNTANFITAGQAPVQSVNGNTGTVTVDGTITHMGGDGTYINVTGLGTGASPYQISYIGGSNAGNNADSIRHRFVDTTGGMIAGSSLFYNLSSNKFVLKPFAYGMTLYGGIPGVDTNLIQTKGGPTTIALPSNTIFMGNGSGVAASVSITGDVSSVNTGLFSVVGIRGNGIPSLSTGFLQWTGSAWAFNNSTFLTANQSITFTAAGDIGGTASGTTALSPTLTLNTITTATSCTYCSFTKDIKGRVTVSSSNTPVTSLTAGTFMSFATITSTGTINADTSSVTGFSSYYLRRKDSVFYATTTALATKQASLAGTGIVKSTAGTISYINGLSSQLVQGDGSLVSNTYPASVGAINSLTKSTNGFNITSNLLVGQIADSVFPGFMTVAQFKLLDSIERGLLTDTSHIIYLGNTGDSSRFRGNHDSLYVRKDRDSSGFIHVVAPDGAWVSYVHGVDSTMMVAGFHTQNYFDGRYALIGSEGGGTTSYQVLTYSGSTSFTFTSVPASYNDYIVFVNGVAIMPTTDYTTSGNVITVPSVVTGDIVRINRIK